MVIVCVPASFSRGCCTDEKGGETTHGRAAHRASLAADLRSAGVCSCSAWTVDVRKLKGRSQPGTRLCMIQRNETNMTATSHANLRGRAKDIGWSDGRLLKTVGEQRQGKSDETKHRLSHHTFGISILFFTTPSIQIPPRTNSLPRSQDLCYSRRRRLEHPIHRDSIACAAPLPCRASQIKRN